MKYFSTFSGIGGFEIGIERAALSVWNGATENPESETPKQGMESAAESVRDDWNITDSELRRNAGQVSCVGYSEIDKYASSVYEHNFPGAKNYGDITKINAEELPDFDCLVGGFPCQAFSIAGKRRGFDDTRGTLFFDLARILRAKQPRYFVFENVKGLLSHDNGNTFRTIIAATDELGYDCQWQVLNSKNFGVPQNRERVYIVGHLRGTPRPEVFPLGSDNGKDTRKLGQELAPTLDANYYKGWSPNGQQSSKRQHIKQLNNPTHSNDRVYASDGISPTLNTMQGGNRQPFVKVPEATKKGYAEAKVGDAINLTAPNSKTRRGRVSDIAPTVDTGMQLHTLTEDVRIRRLTPIECERLQGFPDNWTAEGIDGPISDTQRYKMAGNAVTTNVVQAVFERILK